MSFMILLILVADYHQQIKVFKLCSEQIENLVVWIGITLYTDINGSCPRFPKFGDIVHHQAKISKGIYLFIFLLYIF